MRKVSIGLIGLILLLQISGCANNKDIGAFHAKSKGIVIMKNYTQLPSGKFDCRIDTSWMNLTNPLHNSLKVDGCVHLGWMTGWTGIRREFSVYFIEPGVYSLYSIWLTTPNDVIMHAYLKDDYVKFQVKAGEVVYVGGIIVSTKRGLVANALTIRDQYEEAVSYFKKEYPEINAVPTKRLMQLTANAQTMRSLSKQYGALE